MKHPIPADIAEMRARGYDPSTIARAEEQSEAAREVALVIEAAFAGVTLGSGVGLKQGRGLDDYADAATCAAYRATDEEHDWHRIPSEALNAFHSSLSFFDAAGMRFHLPAFLLADLRGDYGFGMASCLTHFSDHGRSQFALLSSSQRAAVRAFLLHLLADPDEEFYRSDITRALNGFWAAPST